MDTIIGIFAIVLGLICWIGQSLVVFSPSTAVKLGLCEPEEDIEQGMWLFERFSQGVVDILLTWMLPLAGVLMILEHKTWPIFALVGGGVYLYFPGVFIITRIVFKKRGLKIGSRSAELSAYAFGSLWILLALVMIYKAIVELKI
ncbi:MAG: hypothetical protein QNJ54_33385 [Prochloraceae cyanobacterium]|nr:hypothetical protein [Prochloraceae cyanobacterium]